MKPRLLLFTAACMLFAACGNSRGDLSTGIIPAPQQVAWGDGAFRMPSTLLFATNLEGQAKADLEAWMRRSGDGFFPVSFAEAAGDDIPVLYLLLAEGGAPESYSTSPAEKSPSRRPMPPDSSTDFSRWASWPNATAAGFRPL